jgi:hypothetical protein
MKTSTSTLRSVARRHDWVDERSRALHAAIADKIRNHPELLEIPKANIARWMKDASDAVQPALQTWKTMIESWPLEQLLEFLTQESERANELRQSSPFSGILTPAERNEIFAQYEAL